MNSTNALTHRPRRNRRSEALRAMTQETHLMVSDLILPLFIIDGSGVAQPISSMPGCFRYSPDKALEVAKTAYAKGIKAVALFPCIDPQLKDSTATESTNPQGLVPKTLQLFKKQIPELCLITDVAMDPYSSDGHDGFVEDGQIVNDKTLPILCQMALTQARAGADIVAPSDMMDGRVAALRSALDEEGFTEVSIMSYTAKYASAYYGPFRDALDSAPKSGDKKTYQMNPANRKEAIRETWLDQDEGADWVMVKPALAYLDIISDVAQNTHLPVAAYNVSGEYAMIKAAAEKGWLDEKSVVLENLLAIKRAGANVILTYHALDVAGWLES